MISSSPGITTNYNEVNFRDQFGQGDTTSSTVEKKDEFGTKNDFLQLLITEMRHQDPLSPMENKEFMMQLAQLTSVEQITNLNNGMERLLAQNSNQFMDAGFVNYLNREVGFVNYNPETEETFESTGVVDEVRFEEGQPILVVDGHQLAWEDITWVRG